MWKHPWLTRKSVNVISLIISVGTIVAVMGNGCSGDFKANQWNEASTVNPDTGNSPSSDMEIIPGTKTVSVLYANQALDQLASCAGVVKPSDATVKMYESKKGAISVYGVANTVNAAMMMSVISVAGEVCNDLIQQEITSGTRIFKDINLSDSTLAADSLLTAAAQRLALSCWSRPMDSQERQIVMDLVYQNVTANEAQASKKSALLMCTSMLSSLDSLLN